MTLVGIALEHTGPADAKRLSTAAEVSFPMLVDEEGLTPAGFGFKAVPNGVLVDVDGIVRFAKYGGFSIDNEADRAAVERFLDGSEPRAAALDEAAVAEPTNGDAGSEVADQLRSGRSLYAAGRTAAAVAAWREALARDPENFVIRKQIWLVEHPERFYPEIDMVWQREQLARERAAERPGATE
ncbi:MAG: hypothetical protein H0T49_03390 [Chloroflexia bacterium]|nr:hypothetical protein [Chloroflexia bacterium]